MRKKIIETLKKIDWVRNAGKKLKKTFKFLVDLHKRNPRFIFFTPQLTKIRALRPFVPNDQIRQRVQEVENNFLPGIKLYNDVLSFPLRAGTNQYYSGGLIDSRNHSLIEEGIHLREALLPSQELLHPVNKSPGEADLPVISHPVMFAGILYNHFGHFLLESLGRLWAYEYVKDIDPYILFYNDMGDPRYLEKRNFIHQILAGFNIPHEKILFLDYRVKMKQVLIPVQKYGYELCKSPDALFIKFVRSFRYNHVVPPKLEDAKKIYVSRSRQTLGRLIGENIFEKYLNTEGFTIFHPELYSVNEQLEVYTRAERIIFCDGAALHACILLPDLKATIAVVARRRDRFWACRDIIDQFYGYNKKVLWIDCVKEQYQFGLESWYALSIVDWFEVSTQLMKNEFVDNLCREFENIDFSSLLRSELKKYITAIADMPEYTNFLIGQKEPLPVSEELLAYKQLEQVPTAPSDPVRMQ